MMSSNAAIDKWRKEFEESLKPILSKVDDAVNFSKGSKTARELRTPFRHLRTRPSTTRGFPSHLDTGSIRQETDRMASTDILRDPIQPSTIKSKTAPNLKGRRIVDATPLFKRQQGSYHIKKSRSS
jgi:hypothetical protein